MFFHYYKDHLQSKGLLASWSEEWLRHSFLFLLPNVVAKLQHKSKLNRSWRNTGHKDNNRKIMVVLRSKKRHMWKWILHYLIIPIPRSGFLPIPDKIFGIISGKPLSGSFLKLFKAHRNTHILNMPTHITRIWLWE